MNKTIKVSYVVYSPGYAPGRGGRVREVRTKRKATALAFGWGPGSKVRRDVTRKFRLTLPDGQRVRCRVLFNADTWVVP